MYFKYVIEFWTEPKTHVLNLLVYRQTHDRICRFIGKPMTESAGLQASPDQICRFTGKPLTESAGLQENPDRICRFTNTHTHTIYLFFIHIFGSIVFLSYSWRVWRTEKHGSFYNIDVIDSKKKYLFFVCLLKMLKRTMWYLFE